MTDLSSAADALFDAIVDYADDMENTGYWQVHQFLEDLEVPAGSSEAFCEGAGEAADAPNQAHPYHLCNELEPRHARRDLGDPQIESLLLSAHQIAVDMHGRVGRLKALAAFRDALAEKEEEQESAVAEYDGEFETYQADLATYEAALVAYQEELKAWQEDEEADDDDEPEEPEAPEEPEKPEADYIAGWRWTYEQALAAFDVTEADLGDY